MCSGRVGWGEQFEGLGLDQLEGGRGLGVAVGGGLEGEDRDPIRAPLSTIALIDGPAVTLFDVLPTSTSRLL